MNIRLMPPAGGTTTKVNGRTYTCAAGAVIDAPDFDAYELEASGWHVVAQGGVGTTAQRPTAPKAKTTFHDTTLGYNIIFDGGVWRNPATGASV